MGVFCRSFFDMCCAGCGTCHSETTGMCYDDEDGLITEVLASGWKNIDGEWYCPQCYHLDEDTDEFVVNQK